MLSPLTMLYLKIVSWSRLAAAANHKRSFARRSSDSGTPAPPQHSLGMQHDLLARVTASGETLSHEQKGLLR
jgi:hypothetical protein